MSHEHKLIDHLKQTVRLTFREGAAIAGEILDGIANLLKEGVAESADCKELTEVALHVYDEWVAPIDITGRPLIARSDPRDFRSLIEQGVAALCQEAA